MLNIDEALLRNLFIVFQANQHKRIEEFLKTKDPGKKGQAKERDDLK